MMLLINLGWDKSLLWFKQEHDFGINLDIMNIYQNNMLLNQLESSQLLFSYTEYEKVVMVLLNLAEFSHGGLQRILIDDLTLRSM